MVKIMQEQRKHVRQRTYLGAKLEFSGTSTMDCVVRNLSQAGARVEFHNAAAVPVDLTVDVPVRNMRRHARIVWRNFGVAGLVFVDSVTLAQS